MSKFRYKAFISYSHVDEKWARWLHRAIEAYRLPKKLIGSETTLGEVPSRIKPVFRDRDELSSGADLGSTVTQALSDSENLIVICSPAAAASHWVREEIREFVRLGRRDRIFCIIVDGEASATGSIAAVFPDAIAEAGMQEPLAADVRSWADGKQLAKLKLISGILGVPLDQLRRRDLQKRRKVFTLAIAATLIVVTIVIIAVTSRMAAEQRRDSGELLVGYKLNQLRVMLSQAGEPENLDRLREWNRQELDTLIAEAGTKTPELVKSAMQLRDEGIELLGEGEMYAAMEKFKRSWVLFAETFRRNRDDQVAFFELGQAEFWIGQVHFEMGEIDLAEAAFLSYAEITRRLIQLQPKNAEWVLEMAYALNNLGLVQNAREGIDSERALRYMQSALEYNQIALVLDPDSDYYRSELGQSHAYLADAQLGVCDLDGALQSRREGLALETSLSEENNNNPERQQNLALAHTGYAWVLGLLGKNEEAREYFLKAIQLMETGIQVDQLSMASRLMARRWNRIIWLDAMSGQIEKAWAESEDQAGTWQMLLEGGLENVYDLIHYSDYLSSRAWLANEKGNTELAMALIEQSMELLAAEAANLPNNRAMGNALTMAAFHYWEIKGEPPATDIVALLPDFREHEDRTRACTDASMAIRKDVLLGQAAKADDIVNYLLDSGFKESAFLRICRLYYGCSGEMDTN